MIHLDELGQRRDSSSHNSSAYKRGQADGSSVKTNYLRSSPVQTNFLALFVLTDDPSACINAVQDELSSHFKSKLNETVTWLLALRGVPSQDIYIVCLESSSGVYT